MNRFETLSTIGEGAYGVVQRCRNRQTREVVAIKRFKETEEDPAVRKTTGREIQLLKLCAGEHVIALKEAYRQRKVVYLVFEYLQYNLLEVLESAPQGLEAPRLQSLVYQVLKGLAHMHALGVAHRDIKPENLLVSDKDRLKICDFGFARHLEERGLAGEREKERGREGERGQQGQGERERVPHHQQQLTDYVSTRWYRPPELLVGAPYGREIDIWAVGCIMAELIDGNPLFPGDNEIDQLFKIQKCLGELIPEHGQSFAANSRFLGVRFPRVTSPETLDARFLGRTSQRGLSLLKALLRMAPWDRPTALQALRHPFFDGVRDEEFVERMEREKEAREREREEREKQREEREEKEREREAREARVESRKTSASSTVNRQNVFLKSNRQAQYGAPYIKHLKVGGSRGDGESQRLTLKGTRYTRQDWHSSELRHTSQPYHVGHLSQPHNASQPHHSRQPPPKMLNQSVVTPQNPKRLSLEGQKSSSQLGHNQQQSRTAQDKFGLGYSKLSINRIYGGSQKAPRCTGPAERVAEEEGF